MMSKKIHLGSITAAVGNQIYYVTWLDGKVTMSTSDHSEPLDWMYDPSTGQLTASVPPVPGKPLLAVAANKPMSGSNVVFWDETAGWKSWTITGNIKEGFIIRLTSQSDLYLSIQNISASIPQEMLVADRLTMQTTGNFYYIFQFTDAPNVPIPFPSCPPCPACAICPGDGGIVEKTRNCLVPILVTSGVSLVIILILIIVLVVVIRRKK